MINLTQARTVFCTCRTPDSMRYTHHTTPSDNVVLSLQHYPNRLAISDMLLLQYASCQRVCVVCVEHWYSLLKNDGAVVEVGVDEVHRAARQLHPVLKRLLLRLESG